MGRKRRHLFVLIFVLGLIVASAAVIATTSTKLGLDLKGGVELIYQGTPTNQVEEVSSEDIERSIEIIRERVDELGVSEPEVSRLGLDQISVSLPDVTDAQRAIDQVGSTAQLFFYDWEPNLIDRERAIGGRPGQQPSPEALKEATDEWKAAGRSISKLENQQLLYAGAYATAYGAVQLAAEQKPVEDCSTCSTDRTRFYLFTKGTKGGQPDLVAGPEFAREDLYIKPTGEKRARTGTVVEVPVGTVVVSEQPVDSGGKVVEDAEPGWYALKDDPALSGTDITDPKQETDEIGQPNVTFNFTDDGQDAFQEVTRTIAQRGQASAIGVVDDKTAEQSSGHFAVVLDNEVKTRPIINFAQNPDGIDGRTGAQISGGFSGIQEAQDLATILQIGALPINLKLISQTLVSATLGEQALDQGLKAGLIGLLLVIVFLIAYYRLLGVVATLGLAVYAVFFFALIKLIPITMTLPGIAGLILTIGVAADSNIVIFERIKEEVRAGRSLSSAIAVGYRRGIGTIIDANVITFFTAFILFVLATASVKGFAFTLGVGTLVSLFTAVVFTQALLAVFGRGRLLSSPRLLGASQESESRWRFNFVGASRWFFSISGAILVVGALSLAVSQLNFGIDFESGTRINFAPEQSASVEEVRTAVEEEGLGEAEIQETDDEQFGDGFQIQSEELQPGGVEKVEEVLDEEFGIQPESFENTSVGPTFGAQVARSATLAIIFSLLLISAYMAFRFEAKYAVPVLIAVAHDILITAGVYSLAGEEVSSATVAAFLTILGYSLYDTVIVFDRIRENVPRMPRAAFSQIVNRSMSEVLTRSLITGLSAVFLVTMLLIFGGATLQAFAFAMIVGIFSGTYSSIFIAAPVLNAWKEREPGFQQRRERIAAAHGSVPAFADELEVARLDDEEPRETGVEAPPAAQLEPEPRPSAVATAEPPADSDGAEPSADGESQAAADPASVERRERNQQRRERRQQRRKHGRRK
ncbi:MAG TPA: protein translocase subunit SecD [Solirubrobacterales bacterium]|nr:protein translocase subunit SecD [Solirubrobacterales bacterium]